MPVMDRFSVWSSRTSPESGPWGQRPRLRCHGLVVKGQARRLATSRAEPSGDCGTGSAYVQGMKPQARRIANVEQDILGHWFSGNPNNATGIDTMHCEEIAAWLRHPAVLVWVALGKLERKGLLKCEGELGWFRCATR